MFPSSLPLCCTVSRTNICHMYVHSIASVNLFSGALLFNAHPPGTLAPVHAAQICCFPGCEKATIAWESTGFQPQGVLCPLESGLPVTRKCGRQKGVCDGEKEMAY
jgi:hypothetical protein